MSGGPALTRAVEDLSDFDGKSLLGLLMEKYCFVMHI
jgi:hypothetical protein